MNEMIILRTGIKIPSTVHLKPSERNLYPLISAHGLGSKNPKIRNHENDDWLPIFNESRKLMGIDVPYIVYTARGHGESDGWQETAASNPEQFTWNSLSEDMVAVADYYNITEFIASGNSMGSATSLFAAIHYPERVKALIMIRPPTAWKPREDRRKVLTKHANACQDEDPNESYHYVLRGSALSDLPPIINDENSQSHDDLYKRIKCPMLILAVRHDVNHPIITAETLASKIPHSELHIVDSKDEADVVFPPLIKEFLSRVYAL